MTVRVWGGGCLLVLLAIYFFCPFRIGIVCGTSMEPTYHSGQAILVDRGYYRRHAVQRGDVILLHAQDETLIKRVFACAGDAFPVLVFHDDTGINRYVLDEMEAQKLRRIRRYMEGRRIVQMRVPPGHIYVLGDNANASIDSREFGAVPVGQVIGRVMNDGTQAGLMRTASLVQPSFTPLHARSRNPRSVTVPAAQ